MCLTHLQECATPSRKLSIQCPVQKHSILKRVNAQINGFSIEVVKMLTISENEFNVLGEHLARRCHRAMKMCTSSPLLWGSKCAASQTLLSILVKTHAEPSRSIMRPRKSKERGVCADVVPLSIVWKSMRR